ncbi:MAG: hypothetical protein ABI623_12800, partial [bacterium]
FQNNDFWNLQIIQKPDQVIDMMLYSKLRFANITLAMPAQIIRYGAEILADKFDLALPHLVAEREAV